MKTIEELKAFYSQSLMPDILVLEKERKDVSAKVILYGLIILALGGMITALSVMAFGAGRQIGWLIAITFMAIGGMYWMCTRAYTCAFKEKIIERLVKFVGPELIYNKDGHISMTLYEQSQLFKRHVDRYNGDDLVSGRMGETDIRFSELHSQYEVRSKNGSSYYTIFKGLFFVGDFNKDFHGRTVVVPDTAERMLGGVGRFLQSKNVNRDDLIKMDDVEFEKEFAIYGTDQIEARYILTSSLMKRILDFRKKTNKRIYLSFVRSKVFVAIPYTKNLFEPKIFETLVNFAPIKEYFEDLSVAIGIVEDLNLNTRIWSKE